MRDLKNALVGSTTPDNHFPFSRPGIYLHSLVSVSDSVCFCFFSIDTHLHLICTPQPTSVIAIDPELRAKQKRIRPRRACGFTRTRRKEVRASSFNPHNNLSSNLPRHIVSYRHCSNHPSRRLSFATTHSVDLDNDDHSPNNNVAAKGCCCRRYGRIYIYHHR
jgi:hypothetical protein